MPQARRVAAEAKKQNIISVLAEISFVRARGRQFPLAAGLQGKRSMMLALAIALSGHDARCFQRCWGDPDGASIRSEAEGKILEKDPRWDLEVLAAAAHWALRLMRKSLLSWSHLISKRRRSRLHGRCFREEEIVPRACRRTLERWKLAAIGQVHGRLVGSARKGRIFHAWRQGVRRSCSIRLMARQCGLRQCGIVLAAWSRAAAYCSKILSLQRCQLMVKTCGKALAAWRLRSSALQALRRAAARRNHAQEEGALGAWRQLCSERLSARPFVRTRLEMRAEHATMYRTFCDWAWQVAAELSLRLRLADRTRRCQLRSLMEWKGQMVLLQSRRLQAAEAIMSRNAEKKRLAWQYWKRLQFERRHVRRRRSDEWPRLLRWSFRSWHHGLLVSTFLLRRDELSSAGRCRLRRAWTAWTSCRYQVVHRTQSAEKHLCEDAFDAWRFGASPEMCEASMDLLEISASTEEVSKDTQAPDDVNRTLSDFRVQRELCRFALAPGEAVRKRSRLNVNGASLLPDPSGGSFSGHGICIPVAGRSERNS
eukprot:g30987.t1